MMSDIETMIAFCCWKIFLNRLPTAGIDERIEADDTVPTNAAKSIRYGCSPMNSLPAAAYSHRLLPR